MFKKIIEMKNVGCFELLRASSGNEGDFAKVNIVYAPNACGKTTLCDIFRSVQTRNAAYANNPGLFADRLKEVVGRIRPLLETYLRYKYPQAWNNSDWLGDMIAKIRRSSASDVIHPCACLVQELESINDYTKRFHHGVNGMFADVPESRELKTYVKMTLEIIHHA